MEDYQITGTSPYYELYSDTDYWIIDKNSREITMPRKPVIMQNDTGSKYIPFRIERYIDGIDVSEKTFSIVWNNDAGEGDSCLAVNSYMNDEYVIFAWLLDGAVTKDASNVAFQVFITGLNEKDEDYEWKTLIHSFSITKSLNSNKIIQENTQLYTEMLNYIAGVLDGSTGTIYAKLSRNLAVMEARISEIAATAGTNTADTEVADARVRLNGTAADCLGDEVRAKADGYIIQNGKIYLTSGGIVITEDAAAMSVVTDLTAYMTSEEIKQLLKTSTFANGVYEVEGGFSVTFSDGSEVTIKVSSGGLSFDSGYQDENYYIHLTKDGEDIEGFTPFKVSGGSGGSDTGSKLKVSITSASTASILDTSGTAPISGTVTSTDGETGVETGAVTCTITVNGVVRENRSLPQGGFTIDVFKYLSTGTNTIKLTFTDSYGSSVTRNFTRTMESFSLGWNISGSVIKNSGAIEFYLTPTGSGDKTIYVLLDDEVYETYSVSTSGRRLSVSISDPGHGDHRIEAYGEMTVDGSVLESNHLVAAVAQTGSATTPVVAVNWPTDTITQYTTMSIPHLVVDPSSNPADVQYIVNGSVYASDSIDQTEHTWNYKPVAAGTYTFGIMCGTVLEEKEFTVASIGTDISQITDGLEVKVEPSEITSLSDWSYGAYSFELSDGFDEENGGIQLDEENVRCIKVVRGDRLTLNYKPFSTDIRKTGKELKLIYKVVNSTDMNAVAVSCLANGIGLTVRANDVECSSENVTVLSDTCEKHKTELDINIESDSEDRIFMIMEKVSSFDYKQYPEGDNFTQSSPVGITFGSDDCDIIIYAFRGYNRSLTDEELRANFEADGKDGDEINARHTRNQVYDGSGKLNPNAVATLCPEVHVMTWHADRFSLAKSEKVSGMLTHVYTNGGTGHKWTAYGCIDKLQGTSSVGYAPDAGGNHDFDMSNGITLEDGTVIAGYSMTENSIPVSYLNFKDNIASQEHVNNIGSCEWFNRFVKYIRAARSADPRVRDTVEGHMAVLFFHNTGDSSVKIGPDIVQPDETVFYGLGNINNSKKNTDVFAQNGEDDAICIEYKNNTSDVLRGKSDDLSGEDFSGDYDMEFRYLADSISEEEAKELVQELFTFIHECDITAATNTALSAVATFDGQAFSVDSEAYRKARWKAEAPNYFVMDSMLYYQVDTEFELARDNRVKNLFPAYSLKEKKWHFNFAYDRDTVWGINNESVKDIDPGHLESDVIGTKSVFNGADCVIWVNNRAVFGEELRAMYLDRESEGAFDTEAYAEYLDGLQEQFCEALWMEDVRRKSIRILTEMGKDTYVPFGTGRKRLHRRKFMEFQGVFIRSYYLSAASVADSATIRGYTPSVWTGVEPSGLVTITAYCNMIVNLLRGSEKFSERVYAGESVTFDLGKGLNDTEIYPRDAAYLQDLGDLSALYPGFFDAAGLKRCRRFQIGSDVEGYVNTNFTGASFTNSTVVEYINLNGCQNDVSSYDFSPNVYLKEFYCKKTGVTGVTFAKKGRIQTAEMNAIASLTLKDLHNLETLTLEDYSKLASLIIEDCPSVDSYALAKAAENLSRVRLLDIDWSVPVAAYDVLMRLDNIQGIDDDGYNTEEGVLTGNVLFNSISETKYNTIVEEIPEITFTYGEKLEECTVTFQNDDGTVLYVGKTEKGGSIQDPILAGLIETPTKSSTIETGYTYYKWDTALDYIVGDTVITATYVEYAMVYTVQYVDKDGSVKEEYEVPAHGSCYYQGEDLEQAGYVWMGWDQETTDVTQDMVVNAVYVYPTLPPAILDLTNFDYAYSDDADDNSAYSYSELYAIFNTGQAAKYLPQKAKIKFVMATTVINDVSIEFNVHSYGHYELADGSEKMSNVDFYMTGVLISNRQMNSTNTNVGGWDACALRTWLNNTFRNAMPITLRNLVKKSITLANAGNQSSEIIASEDWFRIPSTAEMRFDTTSVPYKDEVSTNAAEIAFDQYVDNTSRIKKQYNGEGTAQNYWTRSAESGGVVAFRFVYSYGPSSYYSATPSYGVCVGFSA